MKSAGKQEAAKKKLDAYKKKANDELAKAREKFKKHEKNVQAYVKKNPAQAAAIAAGLGALLGAATMSLINRKKK